MKRKYKKDQVDNDMDIKIIWIIKYKKKKKRKMCKIYFWNFNSKNLLHFLTLQSKFQIFNNISSELLNNFTIWIIIILVGVAGIVFIFT